MADLKETIKEPKVYLTVGTMILIALIGTTYLVSNPEKLYECNYEGETYVSICEEVSGTRCYFYENTTISQEDCEGTYYFYEKDMCYKKRWKYCPTDWEKSDIKEVIGKPVEKIKITD